jgi:hypothetical protein
MTYVGDEGGVVVALVCDDVVSGLRGAELFVDGRLAVELAARAVRVAGEELGGGMILVEDVEEVAVDGDDDLPPISEGDWNGQPFLHDPGEEGVKPRVRAMARGRLVALGDGLGRSGGLRIGCLIVRRGRTGGEKVEGVGSCLATHGESAGGGRGGRAFGLELGEEVRVRDLGEVAEEGVTATDVFDEELGDRKREKSDHLYQISKGAYGAGRGRATLFSLRRCELFLLYSMAIMSCPSMRKMFRGRW